MIDKVQFITYMWLQKEHQFLLRALKVGFSPNQDGAAEETKDDESEEDLYVNAQGKGDIYVNYWRIRVFDNTMQDG